MKEINYGPGDGVPQTQPEEPAEWIDSDITDEEMEEIDEIFRPEE